MRRVVRATPLGRTATLAQKVGIGSGISAAVTLLVLAPRVWQVGCGYGFSAPTAPLYSLTEYADAPASIPVFMLMFASLLARLIAGWSMAMTVLALSQRMKNQLYAALTGSVLLCLPSLLSVYGLTQGEMVQLLSAVPFRGDDAADRYRRRGLAVSGAVPLSGAFLPL